MTAFIKAWHRACSVVLDGEVAKRNLPRGNWKMTEPRSMLYDLADGYVSQVVESICAYEEGPEQGPFVDVDGMEEHFDMELWADASEVDRERILEAVREGGVYYKTYNVRACPHLPVEDVKDHRKWMLDG